MTPAPSRPSRKPGSVRGSSRNRAAAGSSSRTRVPVWVRAVAAGLLVAASMPPWGWWPLGWAGLALWVDLLGGARAWGRAGWSGLAAAAWFAPATLWMADMTLLGWPLTVAGFSAMFAAAGAVVPGDDRRYLAFPGALVLVELLRWSWPFGGVPIATVAMSQAAGPLAPTARLFGALLLTAAAGTAGAALAAAARRHWKPAGAAALAVIAVAASAWLAPGARPAGEIRVAAVQGGGPQNTRADICANRGVFERHLAASASVSKPVDLVVWPEDVVHPSPDTAVAPARCEEPLLTESEASRRLSALAADLDAVVVAGFFGRSPDGEANLNYSAVFDASGELVDSYHKVKLVPYGELVPHAGPGRAGERGGAGPGRAGRDKASRGRHRTGQAGDQHLLGGVLRPPGPGRHRQRGPDPAQPHQRLQLLAGRHPVPADRLQQAAGHRDRPVGGAGRPHRVLRHP